MARHQLLALLGSSTGVRNRKPVDIGGEAPGLTGWLRTVAR